LLDAGAKVAIATDYNPGSSHVDNLLLVGSIAAPQMKMNQAELWAAMTYNAAHALGLKKQGAILAAMKPRFTLFKAESLSHITYNWGRNFSVELL
jgi:imidazolonepropionase